MSGQLFNQEKPCRMYTVLTNHSTKSKLVTVGERKLRDRLLVLVGTLARDNCALGDPHEPVEVLVKIRFHLPAASQH